MVIFVCHNMSNKTKTKCWNQNVSSERIWSPGSGGIASITSGIRIGHSWDPGCLSSDWLCLEIDRSNNKILAVNKSGIHIKIVFRSEIYRKFADPADIALPYKLFVANTKNTNIMNKNTGWGWKMKICGLNVRYFISSDTKK